MAFCFKKWLRSFAGAGRRSTGLRPWSFGRFWTCSASVVLIGFQYLHNAEDFFYQFYHCDLDSFHLNFVSTGQLFVIVTEVGELVNLLVLNLYIHNLFSPLASIL